jgi:hypothetical protein
MYCPGSAEQSGAPEAVGTVGMRRASPRAISALVTVLACVVSQTACQSALELWIEPGASIGNLVIRIGESRSSGPKVVVDEIGVFLCSDIRNRGAEGYYPPPDQAIWRATALRREAPSPTDRIEYGKESAALATVVGPGTLERPGCYVVRAHAKDSTGVLRVVTLGFSVTQDGSVFQMSQAAYDKLFSGDK